MYILTDRFFLTLCIACSTIKTERAKHQTKKRRDRGLFNPEKGKNKMKKKLFHSISSKEAAKELLKVNRGTLQSIHNVFGIDYNKQHAILKMEIPTTRRAIRNAARDAGYPNAEAVILFHLSYQHNRGSSYHEKEFVVFTLSPSEALDNPRRGGSDGFYLQDRAQALDDAYSKGQFDELRREAFYQGETGLCDCYVILQEDADRTPKKQLDALNTWTRYTVTGSESRYGETTGWTATSLDRSQRAHISRIYWYRGSRLEGETIDQIIDKSGYYIRDRRNNLKNRAAALRAEREKNAYQAQDVTADIAEILKAAVDLKSAYAKAIINSDLETAAAVIRFDYRDYIISGALSAAAKFIKLANARAYKSRTEADKAKNRVHDEIRTAAAKLDSILNPAQTKTAGEEAKTA